MAAIINITGRLAFDHRVQDADVVVCVTEIGEQHDRTHGITLAHLLSLLELTCRVLN